MILQELLGVKNLQDKSAGQILKKLKADHGIEMVRGVYGIVLMHPSWNYVLKLFPKDDCYLHFLNFCKKNSSKHLPKIIKGPVKITTFFNDKHGGSAAEIFEKFYAVKLEKLTPFKMGTEAENAAFIICLDGGFRESFKAAKTARAKTEVLKAYSEAYEDKRPTDLTKHREFAEIVVKVYDAIDSTRCRLDLHVGNLMMRDNAIVIIDPYATHSKGENTVSLLKFISRADLEELTGR